MGDLRVRNVDDEVIAAWKERARQNDHSLQEELHAVLTEEAMRPRRELAFRLRELHKSMIAEEGGCEMPDSTALLREERDARG